MVFNIARFGVTVLYTEPESDGLFGANFTVRTVQVHMSGQIIRAGSAEVVRSFDDERIFQDRLRYSQVENMERSEFGFTRGKKQGYSGWEVYLEPLIVVSSVVAVVLLFFTQRN
jgi:hypothetical protein